MFSLLRSSTMGVQCALMVLVLMLNGCASTGLTKSNKKSAIDNESNQVEEKAGKFSTREIRQIESFISQGEALYRDRDFDLASDAYRQALQIDSHNVRALYRLGNISFRNKDWIKARSYYEKVVRKEPRHSKAQYNLSMTYLSLSEKHLKFFAATADDGADLTMVSDIMRFLNNLSSGGSPAGESTKPASSSLDSIADQFLNN